MSFFTIIQDVNQDCQLSCKIKDSKFTEGNRRNIQNGIQKNEWYPN